MPTPVLSKRFILQTPLLVLCAYASAIGATPEYPFSGRWRMDTTSIKGDIEPTVFQFINGSLKRDDNDAVRADGDFHKVSGSEYVDEVSISIENDHVIREIDNIRGKLAYTVEYVVSQDGNMLTWHVASYTNPNGHAVKSETVQRRVGPVPEGVHLISGEWERVSVSVDSKSDWILSLNGDRFSWRTEDGTGYDAIIGGEPVKIAGDSSGAQALITRPRPDTIVETDLSTRGERAAIMSMQLMPDGKTIHGTTFSPQQNRSTTFILNRVSD